MTQTQRHFLALLGGLCLSIISGLLLGYWAYRLLPEMQIAGVPETLSRLSIAINLCLLLALSLAITTLIYGHLHAVALRELALTSRLLTLYQLLFWLLVTIGLLFLGLLFILSTHTGAAS